VGYLPTTSITNHNVPSVPHCLLQEIMARYSMLFKAERLMVGK
jgi:hypothetical protein